MKKHHVTHCICMLFMVYGIIAANPTYTPGVWKDIGPAGLCGQFGRCAIFTQGMAVDPNNRSIIYLTTTSLNDSTWSTCGASGIYKTTNGGTSWTKMGDLDAPIDVLVDPKNSNHLYACDGVRGSKAGFWVSNDAGVTWTIPQGYKDAVVGAPVNGDYDVYHIDADPTDFNHILLSYHWYWDGCGAGCTAGILESSDGGNTWVIHNAIPGLTGAGGYNAFFLYNPGLGIGNNRTWLYGTQGSGHWRTTDAGANWTKVTDNSMEHGGGQLYYTKAGVLYSGGYPHLMRSTNNGASWTTVGSQSGGYLCVTGDGTNLYTGMHGATSSVLTSPETDGLTWSNYNTQKFSGGPFQMVFDSVNQILYSASTGDGLWALKIPGSTVTEKAASFVNRDQAATRTFRITGDRFVLPEGLKGIVTTVSLYDVQGKFISKVSAGIDGAIKIDRKDIATQAVIVRLK